MNPSIDTISKAIKKANARNVFVLPNNSNIILAAQQASELVSCNVVVLPTKSIMQGISAAMAFMEDASVKDNTANMTRALQNVVTGLVTYAVRDTSLNGKHISEGDVIGMLNGEIAEVDGDVTSVGAALLRRMLSQKPEEPVVTVFYGEDVTEADANAMAASVQADYPDAEFAVQSGGQPLYYYYFAVE
ncbi:MAG: DAK2 domain-containing protein, partial [Eubacteriales bacterium]|nr:DAK2 domain-containing protein [Eubacteriales bacterium]